MRTSAKLQSGLYDCPSGVAVESRPADVSLPLDTQWSAALRHSLVRDGPLAIRGPSTRARNLLRALLLDLATSHSPADVKIWLITAMSDVNSDIWNDLRWLPHTFIGESENLLFVNARGRASALSLLRSIINERQGDRGQTGVVTPIHIVAIDCVDSIDSEELTDLLVDGAPVGVLRCCR